MIRINALLATVAILASATDNSAAIEPAQTLRPDQVASERHLVPQTLELIRQLAPTSAEIIAGDEPAAHPLPAPLMTPRSIESFSDPQVRELLRFPEAY